MIYKLNSDFVPALGRCDLSNETSDNQSEIIIEGQGGKKEAVANYRKVMTQDFHLQESQFFNAIPVNVSHLKSFIEKNSPDLEACRIYITKRTADAQNDDYELLFIPCNPVKDQNNEIMFFQDDFGTVNQPTHAISLFCRRPPDCNMGALLLP